MIEFPSFIIVKSFDLGSEQSRTSSKSISKVMLSRELPGHQWTARMRCEARPHDNARAMGFVTSLQADSQTVRYSDPDYMFSGIGNKVVTSAVGAGDTLVELNNTTGLYVGMMLNFGNHDKMYAINEINGNLIVLNCRLVSGVSATTPMITDGASCVFSLAAELKESIQIASGLSREPVNFNLRLEEALF